MCYKMKHPFIFKLALSMVALSLIGLTAMYIIVNTIVRNSIYDNVIGVAQRDVQKISLEIDAWFNTSNHIVNNMTRILPVLGTDYIKQISENLLVEYDFLADVYVGFGDGSIIGSGAGDPGDDWDSTTRSWYIDAAAARGQLVTTSPYMSALENLGIITSATKWAPDFNGMEAVVVVSTKIDSIINMINKYRLEGGGYLILVDKNNKIISHPNIEYIYKADGDIDLVDIPNGDTIKEMISLGEDITKFEDNRYGDSYFMTFPVSSTGWTLAAVVPSTAISEPVSQNLLVIMIAFATILIFLFILTMVFVSILTRNMEESRITEERLRIIIDNMPLVTNFWDKELKISDCNEAATKLFELYNRDEYMHRFFELSPEYQPDGKSSKDKAEALVREAFKIGHANFEWMHKKLSGELIPTEVTLTRVEWHGKTHIVSFVRDLSDIKKAVTMVEQLENAAFTDALTGARNRRYLMEAAEKELQTCVGNKRPYSLIIIDADYFKKVNDTYGHQTGDEVLKILVARIRNSVKKDTLLARYGGEEFVITLPDVDRNSVIRTAERIRSNIEESAFQIGDTRLDVTISVGIAAATEQTSTLEEIFNDADKALYNAKQTGRNKVIYYDSDRFGAKDLTVFDCA